MSWEAFDKVMPVAPCPLLLASPEQMAPSSPAVTQGLGMGSSK